MVHVIGRNFNQNSDATLSDAITANSSTSVTAQAANDGRFFFAISVPDERGVWLKFQAASVDDDKKGIFVPAHSYWEMTTDNIYTGEISVIVDTGDDVSIYTVEF